MKKIYIIALLAFILLISTVYAAIAPPSIEISINLTFDNKKASTNISAGLMDCLNKERDKYFTPFFLNVDYTNWCIEKLRINPQLCSLRKIDAINNCTWYVTQSGPDCKNSSCLLYDSNNCYITPKRRVVVYFPDINKTLISPEFELAGHHNFYEYTVDFYSNKESNIKLLKEVGNSCDYGHSEYSKPSHLPGLFLIMLGIISGLISLYFRKKNRLWLLLLTLSIMLFVIGLHFLIGVHTWQPPLAQ